MERCPNCRARRGNGGTCRRCGMDLTLLLACEQAAELLTTRALAALAAGRVADAIAFLTQAQGLISDPLIGHLKTFAQTLTPGALSSEQPPLDPERPGRGSR